MKAESWISRDLNSVWHPCSQMSDYKNFPLLEIETAKKSYLILKNGKKVIDAVSSWWCKSLGHSHPRLIEALINQTRKYEHVISANTIQEPLVDLTEKLLDYLPPFHKAFYASEGSMAVEIAMKMSLHAQRLKGNTQKCKFMALKNGYHGESSAALGASDVDLYKNPYKSLLPKIEMIQNVPYVFEGNEEASEKSSEVQWVLTKKQLESQRETLGAIIVEPLLQGAGGMLIYDSKWLEKLFQWAKKNEVYIIADEIMTGFGRTGKPFACDYLQIKPDFICLSKGLTAGFLPLSVVLTTNAVYDLFYGDFGAETSFLHSNTYSGNALAAAVALETLSVYKEEGIFQQLQEQSNSLQKYFSQVVSQVNVLNSFRCLGMTVAAELQFPSELSSKRMGFEIFKVAVKKGALLRPLGNTIYWLPPLNIKEAVVSQLAEITVDSIEETIALHVNR